MSPEEPVEKIPPVRVNGATLSSDGPPSVEVCASCRRPLTRRGPNGECLRCVASFAFLSADEESSTDEKRKPGMLRYGLFEIATDADGVPVELGAGAMGTTYQATDTVLQSRVALKVIDRTLAANPSVRARFLQEARAAAMLRHPHIASVSHYGEEDGECYYVMELIEGETLEACVRREGALSPGLVLEIGVQIARALAAAEAQGIVHRDLKPTNVMLARAGGHRDGAEPLLIKVIDFGLAKAVTATHIPGLADTRGAFVGTPAFASPEQFAPAADERIDTRADIYSLGVTLWYLLCGKLPFVGRTLTEIHEQQTRQPLPLEHLKAARVPAPVVSLLRVMLAVSPGQRPQSARELLALLTVCQTRLQTGRWASRAWFRWAAVAALGLVVAAADWSGRRDAGTPAAPVDTSLAVLPFQNLSPAKEDAFFTNGMHDALAADLGRIERLKLTGPSSAKQYPADKPRDLPAIARTLGTAHLLEGSVRRENDRVHVDLLLTNAQKPTRTWITHYDRPLKEEFSLLGEMTRNVAEHLRVPPSEAESALINLHPTQDPGAWDLYLRSKEGPTVFHDEIELRKYATRRIALLDEAVARDPNFVPAWCALTSQHDNIVMHPRLENREELAVDHRALAEAALAQARRLQPDSGEVHLADATHSLTVRDFERARTEVELARHTLPNNHTVEDLAGRVAQRQGRLEDAARHLEKAVALDPRNLSLRAHCEEIEQATRNYPAAIRQRTAMGTMLPPGALPSLNLGTALTVLEERADVAPLRAALADVKDADDDDHEIRDTYGAILAVFARDESEIRYVLARSGRDTYYAAAYPHPRAWYEGLAARLRKDDAAARTAFERARIAAAKNVVANPADERCLLLLAMIDAGLGRKDEAMSEAHRACAMPPYESERIVGPADRCGLAVVYAWTNQPDLAFEELNKLVSGPAGADMPDQVTFGDFQLNPVWDPLRDDPRFAALVARLAPAASH